MNIFFTKHFFVGIIVSEIQIVSVFGHCPYSVTLPYDTIYKCYLRHKYKLMKEAYKLIA